MIEWFKRNKKGIIRGTFLVPIILVMIISISHVVSWYDLSNPFSWAIYLSLAIEIAAMSSISAASVKIKGGVWFIFVIVTLIQFIGNIFFCFKDTDVNSVDFKAWVELSSPVFEMIGSDVTDLTSQRRWLALLQGGLLPMISLASLHFFIKYGGMDDEGNVIKEVTENTKSEEVVEKIEEPKVEEVVVEKKEGEPKIEEKMEEPLTIGITTSNTDQRFF